MKTYVRYTFECDPPHGHEITTSASLEGVMVETKNKNNWNSTTEKVEESVGISIFLSVADAKELAANLLKAATFSEEAEAHKPKNIRGRY